jgi:hypothetical protein
VRHGLGIDFAGTAEPNDWLLADVRVEGDAPADEVRFFLHADGVLAFFPITPGRFRIIADGGPARGNDKPRDPVLADVQAVVDRRGPTGVRVHDPLWLTGFRINERKVHDYRAGRVFLAGDAAHIHSPAGGQGMNTGMQDAFNLGWKLALVQHGRARPALLDTYSSERSAVGDEVLRNAGALTRLATVRSHTAQTVRNTLMPFIASLGVVQNTIRATLTELGIHYRSSPLSRDERGGHLRRTPVSAGDRAPDVELAAGTRLYDRLRGRRHMLLLVGDSNAAAAVEQAYRDLFTIVATDSAAVRQQFGTPTSAAVVIRPDGYIGYIGEPASPTSVLNYLETYLVPR